MSLPIDNQVLEPNGGNCYMPHLLVLDVGSFWRCSHGRTGFAGGLVWVGCPDCRLTADPKVVEAWEKEWLK